MYSIFKTFVLSLLMIAQVHFAYADTASILPPAKTTFFDANGNPLTSGTVDFYIPSTSTRKTTWQDAAETISNTNPVVLDAGGRALILGSGSYRQVVKDRLGNLIWDQVTSSVGAGGGGGVVSVGDGNNVGTILNWSGLLAPTNYLFSYGQELNRVTYSILLATVTQTQNVTCVGGSPTLTTIADTTQLSYGAAVEAACIPAGSVIVSKTPTTVTLNNNAVIGTTVSAQFFPYGNGNGLTTFNTPDLRGKYLPGRNNMGGAASASLTTTYYGSEPNSIGGRGGNQLHTMTLAELVSHSHTVIDPGHFHTTPNIPQPTTLGAGGAVANAGAFVSQNSDVKQTGITLSNTGSTSSFSIVPPSTTINYVIKVLPDASLSLANIAQLAPGTPNQLAGTDNIGTWGNITVPTGLSVASSALSFNIPALTLKAAPNASNDFVIIYDAAGNATKKATVGSVGSAGASGVTAINGQVGGFTVSTGIDVTANNIAVTGGVPANIALAKTGNYTIANTDCSKTVIGTGGPFTLTLPATAGFPTTCTVKVCNLDPNDNSHHAIRLSGFPNPLFGRLYMQQCAAIEIENGTWQATSVPGRFRPNFGPTLFVDTGGSDTNDGLVSNAAANALRTSQGCYDILNKEYDLQSTQPVCSLTAGQVFGPVSAIGQLVNSAVMFFNGNGGQATIQATAGVGTAAIFLGDFAPYVISVSITWDCTAAAANCTAFSMHQQTGADLNSGTILKGNANTHVGLACDSMCKINGGATVTLSGTLGDGLVANAGSIFSLGGGITLANNTTLAAGAGTTGSIIKLTGGSQLIWSGGLVAGVTVAAAEAFTLRGASVACINTFNTSGTITGVRQWGVLSNSILANISANAIPGTAGINTAAGFINGQVIGVSAAGC